MSVDSKTTYDDIPYPGRPYHYTHPDHLAVAATLRGLQPTPTDRCRVLELGCGDGANIIPMAESLPGSEFVGIDLSKAHIDSAHQIVRQLNLSNITLLQGDLSTVELTAGDFDYIICHGVYSWVPQRVQNRILEICDRQLSSRGVAFISHNTYPGWHVRRIVRDVTQYVVTSNTDSSSRIERAREFLRQLIETTSARQDAYSQILTAELRQAHEVVAYYFFHEYLEESNEPLYFHEFVQRAESHNLKFLGDADLQLCFPDSDGTPAHSLREFFEADEVRYHQITDVLDNRAFRKTLLCRKESELLSEFEPRRLDSLYVSTSRQPEPTAPMRGESEQVVFPVENSRHIVTDRALTNAAFFCLFQSRPGSMTVSELREAARSTLNRKSESPQPHATDARSLCSWLLTANSGQPSPMINISVSKPLFISEVSEFPLASSMARLQAEQSRVVTNRWHQPQRLDGLQRQVLRRLDGTCNHVALIADFENLIRENALEDRDHSLSSEDQIRQCLQELARAALLIG